MTGPMNSVVADKVFKLHEAQAMFAGCLGGKRNFLKE